MERIIYRKTLDLHKNGIQFTLQGFQTADKMTRTLSLSLMASGDTIDLPLEQLMVALFITTPNATVPSINECTIKDNNIICNVPPIVEEGVTEMQLKLIDTRVEGANGVLAAPKFAIEVSKSNTDEEGATQSTTFTALENALAQAKSVYDSRITRIVLSPDCVFCVYYADGTVYTSDALKDILVNGDALISKSYARGQTGIRDGEETDNSMYYSNVSKSASEEANRASDEAMTLLQEVTLHGVYTAFKVDFISGEVEYISPSYEFNINDSNGELEAIGKTYSFEDTVQNIVTEWLVIKGADIEQINSVLEAYTQRTESLETNDAEQNNQIDNLIETATTNTDGISNLNESFEKQSTAIENLNADISNINESLSNHADNFSNWFDEDGVLKIENGGTGAGTIEQTLGNLGMGLINGEVSIAPIDNPSDSRTLSFYRQGNYMHITGIIDINNWLDTSVYKNIEIELTSNNSSVLRPTSNFSEYLPLEQVFNDSYTGDEYKLINPCALLVSFDSTESGTNNCRFILCDLSPKTNYEDTSKNAYLYFNMWYLANGNVQQNEQ